ncbi:MAG TPA: histidine phosphatase family protein [Casimicrobiaceae bacterium]
MKRLTILRHAKSSWDHHGLADFDRPLNDRGWKSARRVGRELKDREIHFDLCVASTAARVRETLDGLVEGYGRLDSEIRFEPRIYEATLATLLDIVRGLPDSSGAPLLVGHNPGLHQLVLELADDDS